MREPYGFKRNEGEVIFRTIFRCVRIRRGYSTLPYGLHDNFLYQLTWLALGHDQAGGSRSAEQVTAL